MLFFTISSNNYLAQVISLGKSLQISNPGDEFKIGLVDKMDPTIDYSSIPWEIVEVNKIGIVDLESLYLKYTITEFSTSVKPFYFSYFFKSISEGQTVIYLDPDIIVFDSFTVLNEELRKTEIIVTPHFTTPIDDNLKQSEEDFLNSGLYNLGFIAIKKSVNSIKMINWWGERLRNKAFIDLEKGLFTDQIWINFVPLFFDGVKILRHPGYNVAYWNLHERKLDGNVVVTNDNSKWPLVFFHFSGYNPDKPELLSKYQTRYSFNNRKDVTTIFEQYKKELISNSFNVFKEFPCYYTTIKEKRDKLSFLEKKSKVPLFKKILRKIILRIISVLDIELDYSKL